MSPGGQGQPSPGLMRYAGMGVELGGAIIGFTLVGLWIDHRYGTQPKGVMIGAVLGIVGGMYNFIRQAILLTKQQLPRKRDDENADDGGE